MRDQGTIEGLLLIEGVKIPMISATRTRSEGTMSALQAEVLYSKVLRRLPANTIVEAYIKSDRSPNWEQFFHGRFRGLQKSESTTSRTIGITCEGMLSALSDMPTQLYSLGRTDGIQNHFTTRFFNGILPLTPYAKDLETFLTSKAKENTDTAIQETIKYYIEHTGILSPLYKRFLIMAKLLDSVDVEVNETLMQKMGEVLLKKLSSGITSMPPASTVSDIINMILYYTSMSFAPVEDMYNDGKHTSFFFKPVMHFIRPPMCNTLVLTEESDAQMSFSDPVSLRETRMLTINRVPHKNNFGVLGLAKTSPDTAKSLVNNLVVRSVGKAPDDNSDKEFEAVTLKTDDDMKAIPLKELYTTEELISGVLKGTMQNSPFDNLPAEKIGPWMESYTDYMYTVSKYSRRSMNINGLIFNRNLVPGFTGLIYTDTEEFVIGTFNSITDNIDFENGSASTSVSVVGPVYKDEFPDLEGFDLVGGQDSGFLDYYPDKFRPANINEKFYSKYGIGDALIAKNKDTTVSDYIARLKTSLNFAFNATDPYLTLSGMFTRKVRTLAQVDAQRGDGYAMINGVYLAKVDAEDAVSEDYVGPPYIKERQAIAKEYAADIAGVQIGGNDVAIAEV